MQVADDLKTADEIISEDNNFSKIDIVLGIRVKFPEKESHSLKAKTFGVQK
jgi:hypothetical protein